MTTPTTTQQLAIVETPSATPAAPVPIFGAASMIEALTQYRELEKALDRAMPDQLVKIGDQTYRKRGYWRAVSVAFNLTVEPLEERRDVQGRFGDGRDNFGWYVTYRATAPNGRTAIGDGSCFALEKAPRFRCPHPQATREGRVRHHPPESCPDFSPDHIWRALPLAASEHNVRAHAHTRAYTRAVSNLVGFGATPADELLPDEDVRPARRRRAAPAIATTEAPAADTITQKQADYFLDVADTRGWSRPALKAWLAHRGITQMSSITVTKFYDLLDELELDRPPTSAPAEPTTPNLPMEAK